MTILRRSLVWLSHPLHLLLTLLALAPILLVTVYVYSYRLPVPFGDEWRLNGRIAFAAADGNLTLHDLLVVYGGHRVFFTSLVTALSTLLTRWNVWYDGFVSLLLALLWFVLLIVLFRRLERRAAVFALVPISLLVFAVFRDYDWWSSRHTHWYFENLFITAILLLTVNRLTGRGLAVVILLGWCATFTMATGMIAWPIILLILLLHGQRNWRIYALIVLLGAPSVVLYLHNSGMLAFVGSADVVEGTPLAVQPPQLSLLLEFVFKFIGIGILFDPTRAGLTLIVGLAGTLIFVANVLVLVKASGNFKTVAPSIALAAFAFGTAIFTALGRAGAEGIQRVFTVQYGVAADMFWIGLAILMVITMARFYAGWKLHPGYRFGFAAGVLIAAALLGLYSYSSLRTVRESRSYWGHRLGLTDSRSRAPYRQCVEGFLFSRDDDCLKRIVIRPEIDFNMLDGLAARRLTIFADDPVRSLLPGTAEADSRVLLATSDAWLNVHIRDLLLSGVGDDRLFHVVVGGNHIEEAATIPQPLEQVVVDSAADAQSRFSAWLGNARQVWVLTTPDVEPQMTPYVDRLVERGYTPVETHDFQPPDAPLNLTLRGFSGG